MASKEAIQKNKEAILYALDDCTGCTDPRSEGTHQCWSKQHFFEWYIEPYYTEKSDEEDVVHLTRYMTVKCSNHKHASKKPKDGFTQCKKCGWYVPVRVK